MEAFDLYALLMSIYVKYIDASEIFEKPDKKFTKS